ncbi:hypothetical protein NQZ68_009189 [Dissostichus eleginoides]|nr:hypothetical protein NQZ68_009189 [Dissostichus eleginoides]
MHRATVTRKAVMVNASSLPKGSGQRAGQGRTGVGSKGVKACLVGNGLDHSGCGRNREGVRRKRRYSCLSAIKSTALTTGTGSLPRDRPRETGPTREKHGGERSGVADAETRVIEGVNGVVTFDITAKELQTPSL